MIQYEHNIHVAAKVILYVQIISSILNADDIYMPISGKQFREMEYMVNSKVV